MFKLTERFSLLDNFTFLVFSCQQKDMSGANPTKFFIRAIARGGPPTGAAALGAKY